MNKVPWFVKIISILALIYFLYSPSKAEKEAKEKKKQELINVIPPPPNDGRSYRGWDFKKKEWIADEFPKSWTTEQFQQMEYQQQQIQQQQAQQPVFYTDEELQRLREAMEYDTEGRYFHIPGRRILTREQEMQEAIDRYIEENIDDILEEYGR